MMMITFVIQRKMSLNTPECMWNNVNNPIHNLKVGQQSLSNEKLPSNNVVFLNTLST